MNLSVDSNLILYFILLPPAEVRAMLACALTVAGAWLPGLHFLGEAPGTENSGVMHSDDGL